MAKKFKEFELKNAFLSGDYIVGYDGDTGEEIRILASTLLSGLRGDAGTSVMAQYSANAESWHYPASENDVYVRLKSGNDPWSVAFRLKGVEGVIRTQYSSNEVEFHDVFQEGDIYIRIELVDGSYSPPIRIVGKDGTSVTVLGTYTSEAELNAAHPTGNTGDAYTINGELWVWNPTDNGWINVGRIKGDDGLPVVLENDGTKIVWHYANDDVIHDLVFLDDLKGSDGATGAAGTNGKQVELQDDGTYIQWRYVGDLTWHDLVAKSSLKGEQGETGEGVPEIEGVLSEEYPFAYLTASMIDETKDTAWVRPTEIYVLDVSTSDFVLDTFSEQVKITYTSESDFNLRIQTDAFSNSPFLRDKFLHLSCTVMIYNASGSNMLVNVQGDVVFKDGINSFEIKADEIGELSFSGIEVGNAGGDMIIRGIFY